MVNKSELNSTGVVIDGVELTNEERIREIAQMVSGSDVTEAAIANAKQLLKL